MNKSTSDHPVSYDCEKVMPDAASDAPKQQQVERMFDDISDSYDSLNRMMTAGLDLRWRRKALSFLRPFKPKHILDEATGTGDFALMACRIFPDASVVGMDISEGMMRVGREKAKRMGLTSRMTFRRADSMALDIPDASFDAVTIAFGVRNFAHLEQGIAETSASLLPTVTFSFSRCLVLMCFSDLSTGSIRRGSYRLWDVCSPRRVHTAICLPPLRRSLTDARWSIC